MNYDSVLKHLMTLLEIPLNQEDENWKRIVPLMFAYAENRIYRELDFLATTNSTTMPVPALAHELTLPITVLVLRQLNIITPVGYSWEHRSRKTTLERVSPETIDMFWPQLDFFPGTVQLPRQFAVIGKPSAGPPPQTFTYSVKIAPIPGEACTAEVLGVIRPEPLSPTNTETFLSVLHPELLCAACMVFASGYQRDFGAQADDPQKAMSWEGVYSALRAGVTLEAARMRGEGSGWTAAAPAPAAQPRSP